MENKIFFKNSKGANLCGILSNVSPNNDKVIIMVHGFSSNKNTKSWQLLTQSLNKEYLDSFRFDLSAHGESEGNFEDLTTSQAVDDVLSAIAFLKKKGYGKIGLAGSSFGGIASIMAASKTKDLVLLALKSPVSDYAEVWTRRRTPEEILKWKKTGVTEYQDSDTVHKLKYAFFEDFKNNQPYEVARLISVPTIIVHGDVDYVIPVKESIKISKLIPDCKLVLVKGADHWYRGEGEMDQLVRALHDFIIEHF